MTSDEALSHLKDLLQSNNKDLFNECYNGGNYTAYMSVGSEGHDQTVTLDGKYTMDELEAIVTYMRIDLSTT